MMLNSKNNQFIPWFADGFFTPSVMKRYADVYKDMMLPYDNVNDYISSTIQKVQMPGITIETVKQDTMFGKEREHKGSQFIDDLLDKRIRVTFKTTEAFFNYMIMHENIFEYMNFVSGDKRPYIGNLFIVGADNEGWARWSLRFDELTVEKLTPFDLDYAAVENEQSRFTMDFKYNLWFPTYHYKKPLNLYKD